MDFLYCQSTSGNNVNASQNGGDGTTGSSGGNGTDPPSSGGGTSDTNLALAVNEALENYNSRQYHFFCGILVGLMPMQLVWCSTRVGIRVIVLMGRNVLPIRELVPSCILLTL